MDISDYLSFNRFIERPPPALLIGYVNNTASLYNPEEPEENDNISIALNLFLEGNRGAYPRSFQSNDKPHVSFGILDGTPKTDHWSWSMKQSWNTIGTNSDSIDKLLKLAEQAPYSDLTDVDIKYDTAVRNCYQITPETVRANLATINSEVSKQLKVSLTNTLYPGRSITLKYNKTNIYKEGGHFMKHVDHGKPGVIGTLVVFHDHAFEGGDLVLQDGDNERHFRDGAVAFYSNIPHWVEPVLSGYRVATTYYIIDDDNDDDIDIDMTDGGVTCTVLETLHSTEFGVCLQEGYAKNEPGLKGEDRKLNQLLPYFEVQYVPVVVKFREDSMTSRSASVYRCTEDDVMKFKHGNNEWKSMEEYHLPCYFLSTTVGNECQPGLINNIYFARLAIFRPKAS
jgi:predicted 2-oxoglutarate/Fe(II)-dependent dioxygenase YbiX